VVTGTEDRLFNNYASLIKMLPAFPLVDGGATRLQPVWVRDVAQAVMNALHDWESLGKTYHLAGPDILTVRELVQFTYDTIREQSTTVPFPSSLAKLAAVPGEWLGAKTPLRLVNPMFTTDAIQELALDKVVPEEAGVLTMSDLGVKPHKVTEGIPIEYLRHYRSGGYDFGSTNVDQGTGGAGGGFHVAAKPNPNAWMY
jgi:NADH dehydrogenase (ubiquinone) 1 alpha subcomplex subunit 9